MIRFVAARLCAAMVLVLASAATAAGAAAPRPATELFAQLPQVAAAALSPNGQWFAAIVNRGGRMLVIARPVDGNDAPRALFNTDRREFRLAWLHWVNDERVVFSLRMSAERGGTKVFESRLVAVNRDGSALQTLVEPSSFLHDGSAQYQDRVVDWLPGDGKHILLQSAASRYEVWPSVYRLNVYTARRELVHGMRFGVYGWITDATHRVRVGVQRLGTKTEVLVCDPDGSRWRTAWSYEVFDRATVRPIGFGQDPNELYIGAYREGRDGGAKAGTEGRRAIFRVDLRDPALARTQVLDHDPGGRLLLDANGRPIGIDALDEDSGAAFWDAGTQALSRSIDAALPERFNALLQLSADGSRYLLYSQGNGVPGQYLIGDRARARLEVLARQWPDLPAAALAPKKRVTIVARDGLELPGFLTLPPGSDGRGLSAVILPHGGPAANDTLAFDPLVAFIANRGHAVLQVNFRGSSGLGPEHLQAGLKRWGLEMQDDLSDSVQWLVKQGVADPARVCIVGGSYGGYAALMGGAKTPDLYRCIVSMAGVSDLLAMADHSAQFVNGADLYARQVGSFWRDRQQLKDTSPVRLAERFEAPVLLVHGSEDSVVPFAQSQAMADALTAAGKPVQLLKLEQGDHSLSHPADRLRYFQALEAFLDRHLAVPAASASVPAGASR